MEFVLIGLVSAFNFIIIKIKLEKKRYEDAIFDLSLMAILALLFSGSYAGMVVAMVASLSISFYLLASPPKFTVALRERFRDEWEELQAMNQSAPKKKKPFNGTTKDIFKDLE